MRQKDHKTIKNYWSTLKGRIKNELYNEKQKCQVVTKWKVVNLHSTAPSKFCANKDMNKKQFSARVGCLFLGGSLSVTLERGMEDVSKRHLSLCDHLTMRAKDGKEYKTDVVTVNSFLLLLEFFPSNLRIRMKLGFERESRLYLSKQKEKP